MLGNGRMELTHAPPDRAKASGQNCPPAPTRTGVQRVRNPNRNFSTLNPYDPTHPTGEAEGNNGECFFVVQDSKLD